MISPAEHIPIRDFESLYIRLRKKEGRIYTDEEVKVLPDIAITHPHYKEWQFRKQSAQRLIDHLTQKKRSLEILEIG